MGVAADNRLFLDIGESLDEPLDWAVDQYDLLVITGGGVAEQDRTEPVDIDAGRQRQRGQSVAMGAGQLLPRPHDARFVVGARRL